MCSCPHRCLSYQPIWKTGERPFWSNSTLIQLGFLKRNMAGPPLPSMALAFPPRTARELAYHVLEQHRLSGQWVQDLLGQAFQDGLFPAPERGLSTELVYGVVRRRGTLLTVLAAVLPRPLSHVEPPLLTLLQLGAYQLLFLDRIPTYAAVHETVELTRALGQFRWTKFANGVLRGVTRLLTDTLCDTPAADAIPMASGRFRRLKQPIFPQPRLDPVGYVAAAYSLPAWLVTRWQSRWGWDQLLALAEAANTPPRLYVRVNQTRLSPQELLTRWTEAGLTASLHPELPVLAVEHSGDIEQWPGYAEGWWLPQDVTAVRAALWLDPPAGGTVWDVCAAPGGKATHLAELVGPHGTVLATDVHADRLERVRENAQRLGFSNIRTAVMREDGADCPAGPFDAVLLDAPCSNTGVLHRRPEVRWRLQLRDLGELSALQQRLLQAALDRLRPGGRLVYSTCSIEPEENELVVETVLKQRHEVTLCADRLFLPATTGDGGYQALLHKTS